MSSPIHYLSQTLKDFVAAEQPLVLSIAVPSDKLSMATRIAAGFDPRGELGAIVFPDPVEGESAIERFRSWANAIEAQYVEAVPAFAKHRERFFDLPAEMLPSLPDRPRYDDAGRDPAGALAGWVERVAEVSSALFKKVVLLTYADDLMEDDVRDATKRLGKLLGTGRVALIVVDASTRGLFDKDETADPRVVAGSLLAVDTDAAARFREFVRSDSARVLVAGGASNVEPFLESLGPDAGVLLRIPYRGRVALEESLWSELAPAGVVPDPAGSSRSLHDLARALEQARDERGVARFIVAVDVRPSMTPKFLAGWAADAARALADTRIKFVIVEDPAAPVHHHLVFEPMCFAKADFDFNAGHVESMLETDAREGQGPRRFSGLLGLAGFASGREEHEAALRHLTEAVPLAANAGDQIALALQEGSVHARRLDFERAAVAYERGIDVATSGAEPVAPASVGPLVMGLAGARFRQRSFEDAAALYEAASGLFRQGGALVPALALEGWRGEALRRQGKPEDADRIWSAALEEVSKFGPDLSDATVPLRAELLERRARLMDQRGDAQGRQMHQEAASCGCEVYVPDEP